MPLEIVHRAAPCRNVPVTSTLDLSDPLKEKLALIFAELQYSGRYRDLHAELEAFLAENFSQVRAGLQGDSWFCILDGAEMVAVDTFTSMKHQVKSASPGVHVQAVIDALRRKYSVRVYDPPEIEAHEDS